MITNRLKPYITNLTLSQSSITSEAATTRVMVYKTIVERTQSSVGLLLFTICAIANIQIKADVKATYNTIKLEYGDWNISRQNDKY